MWSRVRWLRAGAVAVVATSTVVGVGVAVVGSTTSAARPVSAAASGDARALAVLHRWDRRRAATWAAGDRTALARLYVAGSRTGRRDARDLARWTARGLRVDGLDQQVAAFHLVVRQPRRMVVVVTDRTVDAVAVGGRHPRGLPRSAWLAHRVTLRRVRGTWRVVEARAQPAR